MFLEEYIENINQKLSLFKDNERILIWGAGESAVRLFQYTNISLYNIMYIVDEKLHGQFFWGKTIMPPIVCRGIK